MMDTEYLFCSWGGSILGEGWNLYLIGIVYLVGTVILLLGFNPSFSSSKHSMRHYDVICVMGYTQRLQSPIRTTLINNPIPHILTITPNCLFTPYTPFDKRIHSTFPSTIAPILWDRPRWLPIRSQLYASEFSFWRYWVKGNFLFQFLYRSSCIHVPRGGEIMYVCYL